MSNTYKVTVSGPDKRINSAIAREILEILNDTVFDAAGVMEDVNDKTWSAEACDDHDLLLAELDLYDDFVEVEVVTQHIAPKSASVTSAKLIADWDFHAVSED